MVARTWPPPRSSTRSPTAFVRTASAPAMAGSEAFAGQGATDVTRGRVVAALGHRRHGRRHPARPAGRAPRRRGRRRPLRAPGPEPARPEPGPRRRPAVDRTRPRSSPGSAPTSRPISSSPCGGPPRCGRRPSGCSRSRRPSALELTDDEVEALFGPVADDLAAAGLPILWPSEIFAAIELRPVVGHGQSRQRRRHRGSTSSALGEMRWDATVDGAGLTETELLQLADAKRPVVRLRGRWVRADPARLRKLNERTDGRPRRRPRRRAVGHGRRSTASRSRPSSPARSPTSPSGSSSIDTVRVRDAPDGLLTPSCAPTRSGAWPGWPRWPTSASAASWPTTWAWARRSRSSPSTCLRRPAPVRRSSSARPRSWRTGSARPPGSRPASRCTATTAATAASTRPRRRRRRRRDRRVHLRHRPPRRRRAGRRSRGAWWSPTRPRRSRTRCRARPGPCAPSRPTARFALTGTPVENRLSDLWALLDWTTPGLLGTLEAFQREVAIPIERERDEEATARLAAVVRPFLLRRRKSDPAHRPRPAAQDRDRPLRRPHRRAGHALQGGGRRAARRRRRRPRAFSRKGLVLKLLTALKQICNHPAQYLHQDGPDPRPVGQARRRHRPAAGRRRRGRRRRWSSPSTSPWATCSRAPRLAGHRDPVPPRLGPGHAARGDGRPLPGRRGARVRHLAQGRRHRPQPHPGHPRLPLRPLVEPGGRGPGQRPGVAHRPGPAGAGPPHDLRGHARGADRRAARGQAGPGRLGRSSAARRGSPSCPTTSCGRSSTCRTRHEGGTDEPPVRDDVVGPGVDRRARGHRRRCHRPAQPRPHLRPPGPGRGPRRSARARSPGWSRAPNPSPTTCTSTSVGSATTSGTRCYDAIAAKAGHAAALLDGELDPGVVADAEAVEVDLLPRARDLRTACSCPDDVDPCKHAAAALLPGGRRARRRPVRAAAAPGPPARRGARRRPRHAGPATRTSRCRPPTPEPRTIRRLGRRRRRGLGPHARRAARRCPWWPTPPAGRRRGRANRPSHAPFDGHGLRALVADAARRAWELCAGSDDTGLALDERADLARRAVDASPLQRDQLALRTGVPAVELDVLAAAWRWAGAAGVRANDEPRWTPPPLEMAQARDLVIDSGFAARRVHISGNRVTAEGRVQFRRSRDGNWYLFSKASGRWAMAAPPEADVEDLLLRDLHDLSTGRFPGRAWRRVRPMATLMDPTDLPFVVMEARERPMHVGGLQLFTTPADAGPDYLRGIYEAALERPAPSSTRCSAGVPGRPRSIGRLQWEVDRSIDLELPRPPHRPAPPGTDPRAARGGRPAARHAARPQPPAVGGPPHRGSRRRPVRRLHQGPPCAGRRRVGHADAVRRPVDRPRRARHAPAVGGPHPHPPGPRRPSPSADAARGAGRTSPPAPSAVPPAWPASATTPRRSAGRLTDTIRDGLDDHASGPARTRPRPPC